MPDDRDCRRPGALHWDLIETGLELSCDDPDAEFDRITSLATGIDWLRIMHEYEAIGAAYAALMDAGWCP